MIKTEHQRYFYILFIDKTKETRLVVKANDDGGLERYLAAALLDLRVLLLAPVRPPIRQRPLQGDHLADILVEGVSLVHVPPQELLPRGQHGLVQDQTQPHGPTRPRGQIIGKVANVGVRMFLRLKKTRS